uniref:hypothetical protein n=1 Tax=Ramlibacter montanisoli TaxID=2732512 RepID=UPI0035A049DD
MALPVAGPLMSASSRLVPETAAGSEPPQLSVPQFTAVAAQAATMGGTEATKSAPTDMFMSEG